MTKRMQLVSIVLVLGLACTVPLIAQDTEEAKVKKGPEPRRGRVVPNTRRAELAELTVTGTLVVRAYAVIDEDGNETSLPAMNIKEGEEPAFDLAKWIGQTITVTGNGIERKRRDKTFTMLRDMTSAAPVEKPEAETTE